MKKTLLIAASLSVLATSAFAKVMEVQDRDFSASPISKSSIFEENFEAKKDQKTDSTAQASEETKEAEGWGTWAYNKAWDAGKVVAEKGARVAAGGLAAAYLTPCLNPAVNAAGELADWGVCGGVTAATGCYPVGWVAGKGAKIATIAAANYVAPTVAYTAGYYAPEIATGAYNAGKAACNGAYYAGEALYNGATGAYNYFYGS